ncbi:unnamed protein product [Paramecium primaurelia]|uniref:Uncharacterized protein n=1 Tax=Paramecium primaurelia TaxID=5886 RepID=A0A8S1P101_PARPR|nr:unnamed protein product [Paramecium primaurelia]
MKKQSENEKIAIYASQMMKLHGKILEKKLTKMPSKQQFESQSQNISNNNSPAVGRQKSYENLLKVNRTFINPTLQVSQQKLCSILNVMAGQQTKPKNQSLFNNELIDTVKISHKLRKNQSMIQMEQQSPQLTKNSSFHRPNSSVKIKNSNSVSCDQTQIQKIKEKIKLLLQERENNWQQDQKEMAFMIKFNQTLNQLLAIMFQDQQSVQPASTQDSNQALQIDHFFKRQIQILQHSFQQQIEKKKMENILISIKKKHESLLQEHNQLLEVKKSQDEIIINLQQQINGLSDQIREQDHICQNDTEILELKYLVQGQFEAIQKLLQREQLTKIFLKRVGDSSIIEMFEQFISNAEQGNQDETEGNLNIDINPINQPNTLNKLQTPKQKISSPEQNTYPLQILSQYEDNYKQQLNLCDSLLADDSRINDSEESSFEYKGKEQATEISCYFNLASQFVQPQMKKKSNQTISKEKLKINMMDVLLAQAAQKHQEILEQQQQQQQKILPDDLLDEDQIDSNQSDEEVFNSQKLVLKI